MKMNQNIPSDTSLSLWREKLNTVIERDILFIVLFMLLGLLHMDTWHMRGFPFTWVHFMSHSGHAFIQYRYLFLDLLIAIIIVATSEFINAAIKRASEPVAFRSSGKSPDYANIFDDAESVTAGDAPQDPFAGSKLAKKLDIPLKSFSPMPSKSVSHKPAARTSAGKVFSIVFLVTFLSILVVTCEVLYFGSKSYNPQDDAEPVYTDDIDGQDDSGGSEFINVYDSPFFDEDEYLYPKCEEAMDKLREGDAEWLSSIGEGDAQALIDCTDWKSAELEYDYKTASSVSEDYGGFIRFIARTNDGEYMIGFKFTGEKMAWKEENAVLSGIAVCPYSVWDNYDFQEPGSWGELSDKVDEQTIAVGDYQFISHNILTW